MSTTNVNLQTEENKENITIDDVIEKQKSKNKDDVEATKSTRTHPNNWKPIALATILGLAIAIAIIGFQSFQVQSQSDKIRKLEIKALNEQKNLAQIESLNQQLQTLTQDITVNKSDLEQKTKLLAEFQEKATGQADAVKAKDTQIAKLETENKNLANKNATLTTENAGLRENAVNIRDRINTLFAPKR